ncbi:methionine adenosyltransferase [Roseiflexus sp.]|uniref:methionine adenosyltransferase n=1 Tax=Roseiflexus sp. TaxID=2562120 RepID=UPI00398BA835
MALHYIFTSESVSAGHPDKLCDQISDALVGHYLRQDPFASVVAECAVSTGILFVSVKVAADAVVDIPNTAREIILEAGYDRGAFNGRTCTVMTSLSEMNGLRPRFDDTDSLAQLTAQENVTLFGYACAHTPDLAPLPIWCAHRLMRQYDRVRRESLHYLAPDAKCQAAVAFSGHIPRRIDSITLLASQQDSRVSLATLRNDLMEQVIHPAFADQPFAPDDRTRIQINPEGAIFEGGPALHAGLTGRKNGVDTYGGFSRQSGAALSGKDPTRIDRVGAYAARHAAKNIVAAGLAEQCEVQLSYSIGIAEPVSVRVETFGAGRIDDDTLTDRVAAHFDFRPGGIIRRLRLRELATMCNGNLYRQLAVYGHVGRSDLDLPWEATDEVEALRAWLR